MKHNLAVLAGLACVLLTFGAQAAVKASSPHQIISQLRNRIAAIGESTQAQGDFDTAILAAVSDLRTFISRGEDLNQLTIKDKWGKTPLNFAAYMGFSEIVAELLAQPGVKIALNEPDDNGVTPWTYSVFAARQSAFACNPKIFASPFSWAPLHVSLPYYVERNAYVEVRRLLENAGATTDMEKAKRQWNEICKFQPEATRQAVDRADDLQAVVIAEGQSALNAFLIKLQKR